MHLTNDSFRRLADRTLPGRTARALAAHLRTPCEPCETFLVQRPEADRFDGRVDLALLTLAEDAPAAAGHDLEYARIQRALRAPPPAEVRPRPARLGVAVAAAVAMAGMAGLVATALSSRTDAPPAWDGVKGAAAPAIPLRLRFVVLTPAAGGPPTMERGLSGLEVPAAASLQFQVELGRPAHLLLARAGRGGAPEIILSTRLGAGRQAVTLDGQPAAYPLAALSGPQRFLALASEARLGPEDAARAIEAARASPEVSEARHASGKPISLDLVEVRVRP